MKNNLPLVLSSHRWLITSVYVIIVLQVSKSKFIEFTEFIHRVKVEKLDSVRQYRPFINDNEANPHKTSNGIGKINNINLLQKIILLM